METLKKAFKIKEIRNRLFYTFLMLVVIRLGCQIPIPFVNASALKDIFGADFQNTFSLFSMFTGGSLENMSIFALNITPYITASIIVQLLTIAIPKLDEMQKDGEEGRKKMTAVTRYLTVVLALIESAAMTIGFRNQALFDTNAVQYGKNMSTLREWAVIITGILAMTAGSTILMWLGERITEKGVGNGISIVLTINIISRIPTDIATLFKNKVTGPEGMSIGARLTAAVIICAIIVGMIVLVVILQEAIRKISVQMSQKVQGRRQVGARQSNIPLKVNTAGVIPIIFASSILQFPVVIASFFGKGQAEWNWKYSVGFVAYVVMIIFFAYFYTSITFNPREVAKNLNDRGGFIPGIRSGKPTVEYLTSILNYIILIGAVGLIIVATIPIVASGVANANVSFGGTSIIIIVGVIVETIQTIKSMITERGYSNVKGIF